MEPLVDVEVVMVLQGEVEEVVVGVVLQEDQVMVVALVLELVGESAGQVEVVEEEVVVVAPTVGMVMAVVSGWV